MIPIDGETLVYRLLDDEGTLLYVGVTNNGMSRMAQHLKGKPWWPQVSTTQWVRYPSRAEALEAERQAINEEDPIYNFNPRGRGRPPIGPERSFRFPDDLYDQLRAEARRQSIPIAAMLRRILTERYEGKTRT